MINCKPMSVSHIVKAGLRKHTNGFEDTTIYKKIGWGKFYTSIAHRSFG